ncbi:hypothetical protein P3X46_034194 [Hevea brasiliensis]|uniref:Cytochrome P450 n=1 Tax=Hevea brasiliensis TaxID=3981 RepID=A0ABQ9KBP6_HEVBR|nr:hypothetical protein P3X46_034194 [Hevea brasiliensis]
MTFSSSALCLLLLTWTLIWFRSSIARARKSKSCKIPPGPVPLPVVGNIFALGDKPHKSLAKLLGHITTVVISSAAMAKEIIRNNDLSFSNRTIPDAVRAVEHSKFSMAWLPQDLRRLKVQELLAYIQECYQHGVAVDIGKAAFSTSLNLLSSTIFQRHGLGDDAIEAGRANCGDYFPLLRRIDLQGIRKRMATHFTTMFRLFDDIINARLEERKRSDYQRGSRDVLDALLNITEGNRGVIDQNDIPHLLLGRNFELIPFGAGRPICPGMPLALGMVHLMLASLIHSFDWKLEGGVLPPEMDMEDKFGITIGKDQPLRVIPIPVQFL